MFGYIDRHQEMENSLSLVRLAAKTNLIEINLDRLSGEWVEFQKERFLIRLAIAEDKLHDHQTKLDKLGDSRQNFNLENLKASWQLLLLFVGAVLTSWLPKLIELWQHSNK
ncbi:MAG: hypothetical protein NVSMB70_02180 [Chamaesiphon sp.]